MKRNPRIVFFVILAFAATIAYARSPNGVLEVSALTGDSWNVVAELPFDQHLQTIQTTLPGELESRDGLSLRFTSVGGGASHIDLVSVAGYRMDNPAVNYKLARQDNDVLDVAGLPALKFSPVAGQASDSITLSISARIEAERISEVPFRFPKQNTFGRAGWGSFSYYYQPGSSRGALQIDGELNGEELGEPLFAEYIPVGSGHPQGVTYGWVMDDGEYLYAAIDFTSDNTMDGGKDYARLYINTPDGYQEFTASVNETTWGRPGFAYTERVGYQHKVYEFRIPLQKVYSGDGRLELSFETYGTASPNGQMIPDIVYNSLVNEYLVVYQQPDGTLDGPVDIKAQRIDYLGATVGGVIDVASSVGLTSGASFPDVSVEAAYDPISNRYLVVWVAGLDDAVPPASQDGNIVGQLVNGDGTLFSGPITIAGSTDQQRDPYVVYEPTNSRFLVVWEDEIPLTNINIYGRFVTSLGSLPGSQITIASGSSLSISPVAAVDTVNRSILVAFLDDGIGANESFGRFVSPDGNVSGGGSPGFPILSRYLDASDLVAPSLTFNESAELYLLAANESLNNTVMIRSIGSDGTLFDHSFDLDTTVDADDYEQVSLNGAQTDVEYNPASDSYLVVWDEYIDTSFLDDLRASVVPATLVPGVAQDLAATLSVSDIQGAIAANPYGGDFLVTHFAYDTNTVSGTYSTLPVGAYDPDPNLNWVTGNGTEGTATPSGLSETTFTFEIEYFSPSDTAPATAELWIDLDYDGAYADPVAPVFAPPAGGSWFTGGAILALLALGAVFLYLTHGRSAPRLAALVLIAGLVVAGCRWWDGTYVLSPGYTAPDTGPVDYGLPEIYVMTEANPGDTVYTDGKVYTVDVDIQASPGAIPYKFVFDNGSRRAYAVGAVERRLTITG